MENEIETPVEFERMAFFNDFAEVLNKHGMKNALIVYIGHGQVFNTTFNAVDNGAAGLLNQMSDAIDDWFKIYDQPEPNHDNASDDPTTPATTVNTLQ